MHGTYDDKSKGGGAVNPSSKGSSPQNLSGTPGKSMPQGPIPGPSNPGQPVAMKKALAKKSTPNKGRNSPGRY
jgi:hypothetical protein